MSAPLIALIGLVYTAVAVSFFLEGRDGMGIAFIGYAIGNVGLFMEA